MPDWTLARRGLPPTTLPPPGRDYSRSPERIGGAHTSLNGYRTHDVVAVKRTYTLSWAKLSDAQFRLVEQYVDLTMGLGPFEYREPAYAGMRLVNITAFTEATPLYVNWHTCTLVLEQV
jgi:hypothetical protein